MPIFYHERAWIAVRTWAEQGLYKAAEGRAGKFGQKKVDLHECKSTFHFERNE